MNNWGDEGGQEGHLSRMRRESLIKRTRIQAPEPTDAKATGREGTSQVQGAAVSTSRQVLWKQESSYLD